MDMDELHIKPLTYKLNMTEEEQKKLKPFFKVSSGASTRITKIVKHPHEPNLEDKVEMKTKEKGTIHVELWNRNSAKPENLIGKGTLKWNSLSDHEGKHEEWIPLKNSHGIEVGKALVEVTCHAPDPNKTLTDDYKKSIEGFDRSFRRVMDNMDHMFSGFPHFALGGQMFPSLTYGQTHDMINEEQPKTSDKQSTTVAKTQEGGDMSLRNERRDVMARTFADMHNSFERTMEEMHNRFELMTREMFGDFEHLDHNNTTQSTQASTNESDRKGMDVEKTKEVNKNEKTQVDHSKG